MNYFDDSIFGLSSVDSEDQQNSSKITKSESFFDDSLFGLESPVAADTQDPSPDSVVADLPTAPVPQPESQPIPDMMPVTDPLGGDVTNEMMTPEPSGPSVYPSVFDPPDPRTVEIETEQARLTDVASQLGPTIDKTKMNVNEGLSSISGTPGQFKMNVMGSDVPIDDETAIKTLSQTNTMQLPESSLLSGFVRLNKAVALAGTRVGMRSPAEAFKMIGMFNRIAPDTPPDIAAALKEMTREDATFSESFMVAMRNPKALLYVVGESFPMSAPSLAVFLTGTLVGTPKTGVAAGAAATYAVQYSDTILDEMQKSGVNMKDDAAMLEAFTDPDFIDRARVRGNARGIPIAFFDAMSMGLSGKILAMATAGKASIGKTVAGGAGETIQQSGFGGLGEFVAQDMEIRLGFRDKVNWGEVNLEAIAEGPIGAVETAIAGIGTAEKKKAQQEMETLEKSIINDTVVQFQNPQGKVAGFVDGEEKLQSAEFASTDMKSRVGRLAAQVEDEEQASYFDDSIFGLTTDAEAVGGAAAPLSPPVRVNTPSAMNETTSRQITNLQDKAAKAARLAQETEDNIKAAEGKAIDLDAKRDEEFRADAEQYAKKEREKAEKLSQQAQELQQFYATPEGQRYAAEIEAIQKEADEAGLNVDIAARLNTVPRENIDAAIEAARQNLEFNKNTNAAKTGNAPPIPNTPVTDPAELLAPLEGRQTRAAEGNFISEDEKQRALEVVNRLNKQLNDMGFELGQSLNVANSTEEARNLRSELIMAIGVYNELQSQRLARDKQHKNFKPANLSKVEANFKEIFGSAETAPAPAAQPQPEPEAELENPQAKDPLPFAIDAEPKNRQTQIKTPGNLINVKVKAVYVDVSDLKEATGVLQPRDRSRDESDLQILDIATKMDPDQLVNSPLSTSGMPVIARDGTLITGNGRKKGIELAYNEYPEQAEIYRQAIKEYGKSQVTPRLHTVDNIDKPVLVFMLDEDLSLDQLAAFADQSNINPVASMAATERAKRDARVMGLDLARKFQGGDMGSAANRSFVKEFIQGVVSPTEQNQMSNNGILTLEGEQRMRAAILGIAFDHSNNLVKMLESRDDNVKAITNAMLDAAPAIAGLKADIKDGIVPPEFDISINITEAARNISDARAQGIKIADMLAQQDAFSNMSPETEALIVAFYNDEMTRARSGKFITDVLRLYVEEANLKREGGMFEDTTTPKDIIQTVRSRADGKEGQGGLFTEDSSSDRIKTSSEQARRGSRSRSSQDTRTGFKSSADTGRQGAVSDRPVSAKADDSEVGSTDSAIVSLDELDQIKNQRTEEPGSLVQKEKDTNRLALAFTAFADAGVDPARGTNLPVKNQIKILSKMVTERFGMKIQVTEQANPKHARDQLLMAYHQLSSLASTFGLPYKAIGLDGTLTFVIAKEIGAYGMYIPAKKAIAIPRRVNSFAHEWFHALDGYIFDRFNEIPVGEYGMQTDAVRSKGEGAFNSETPNNVKAAYIALLKTLFKDKAGEASQLNSIEQKMREFEARNIDKDFRNMETWKRLDGQRQRILEGTSKSKAIGKTQYRKDAEFFAPIYRSDVNYWASPREMFARAGEAFSTHQMHLANQNANFLGASEQAYTMTLENLGVTREELASAGVTAKVLDSRLALTFPKGVERMEIFGAFRNLLDALSAETTLGDGNIGQMPGEDYTIDIRDFHIVPEKEKQSLWQQQKQEWRTGKRVLEKLEVKSREYQKYEGNNKYNVKAMKFRAEDALSPFIYAKQGTLKAMIKRYPDSKRLLSIFQKLGTQTGGQLQTTNKGGTLFEAQDRMLRVFADRMRQKIDQHDIMNFTEAETEQLRMILTSQDDMGSSSKKVVAAAGDIRSIYDQIYQYLEDANLDIGYAESGYMQRLMDTNEVWNNRKSFEADARKIYSIVFKNEVGNFDESLEQINRIRDFIQGTRYGIARGDAYKRLFNSEEWADITEARTELDAAKKDDVGVDDAQAKLDEAVANARDLFEEFYNAMDSEYQTIAAAKWWTAIIESGVGDPEVSGAPQAAFSKKRTLPPEADAIMDKYYISDPIENLTGYIMGAVRKAEYNRRFGKHLIPQGENPGNVYEDFLQYELKKLASEEGLLEAEISAITEAVNTMLGKGQAITNANGPAKFANKASALLSIMLLIRAPISSIAEPFTTALTTNEVSKGASAMIQTLQAFPGVRKLSSNLAEDIRLRQQFVRMLGIIDDPAVSDVIANRIGGEFAGDGRLNKILSSFFNKIQLTPMTNAQRRTAAIIGLQYFTEIAHEYRNPINQKEKIEARDIFKDFGVAEERMDQFVDYLLSINETKRKKRWRDHLINGAGKGRIEGKMQLPPIDDVMNNDGTFSDMGEQLAVSLLRFANQTVQDPKPGERPLYAEKPLGRFVYGIMSFMYSFHDKVLLGMTRRSGRAYRQTKELGGSTAAARGNAVLRLGGTLSGPLLTLVLAHTLVSTLREWFFNQERWDREWDEADEDPLKFFTNYLGPLAASRAGLFGAADPVVNAFMGLKYNRDLATSFLGTGSYYATAAADLAAPFSGKNSPNTLYSEYRFLRGFWNLTVNPFVSSTIAKTPMIPPVAIGATAAGQYITSPSSRDAAINLLLESIYGERYVRGGKGKTKRTGPEF